MSYLSPRDCSRSCVGPRHLAFDTASLEVGGVAAGASLAVAIAMKDLELEAAPLLLVPYRLFWAPALRPGPAWLMIKANFDVAWRVLHPKLPIRPGIIRARTTLKRRRRGCCWRTRSR